MSNQYRKAENLLYSFPVNEMRYRESIIQYMRLRAETDCRAQSYTHSEHSEPSDPPSDYVNRLMKAEAEIKRFGGLVREVREMRYDLRKSEADRQSAMYQVLELYYFKGMSMKDLAMHLGMNERTIYRRRNDLVRELMRRQRRNARQPEE